MPARRRREIPADRRVRELAAIYGEGRATLERLVREALERGAEGTAAYRRRQLAAVVRELSALQDRAIPVATAAASEAYSSGLLAADRGLGLDLAFSGVHQQAVDVLADNMAGRLNGAAQFVGRRTEDAFRRAALRETAAGLATGSARREVSEALVGRLVREGVTDALTGFVDAAGKRWDLDTYARMVARTTTREAVTAGTVNRMLEAGADLVTISDHSTRCEICGQWEGGTYSLTGETEGYEVATDLPPYHPFCEHVATPADANLDAFEEGLRAAA